VSSRTFTVTVEQDPEAALTAEEAFQALSLVLLPRAKALWESWVESGLLTTEDGEGGRHWKVNGTPSQPEAEDRAMGT
jgi:hypothetical protein